MVKPNRSYQESERPRGRPATLVMPAPIPGTPANIARACMQGNVGDVVELLE